MVLRNGVLEHYVYRLRRFLVHATFATLCVLAASGALAQEKVVLAFGDSLTAGYQLDPGQGFAPQLERALQAEGLDARVINAGVSGDTSARGRARLDWTLDNLDVQPDLAIVELGANDLLRGLPPQETLRNLNAIIETLTARGIDVLLTGMVAPPQIGEQAQRYYNAIFPFLANRHEIGLYPFFMRGVALRPHLLLDDGLHPNPRGVSVVVAGIAPQVIAALNEAS
ncbi:MAG: arylesterase [Pacificimonas sp.]|jgi:acyl-CoA thioesterase-1|nr:arylesterase [Pacificimonas sp.]